MVTLDGARLLACAGLLCWAAGAPALENDSAEPIVWRADGGSSMSTEDGARFLQMTENVVITQGSLEISGDDALLEYGIESNELRRVTVQGAPARYRQSLDDSEADGRADADGAGEVAGSGDTILLYTDDDGNTVIELVGNAEIASRDMHTRCERILYVTELELIRASGNCVGAFTPGDN